jgi:hypothetical protein
LLDKVVDYRKVSLILNLPSGINIPLILLFNPLPRVNLAHLVNSSIARLGFDEGVVAGTVRGAVVVAVTALGRTGDAATGTGPLVERGPVGATGGALALPLAPTVVQAPEPALTGEAVGALLARSA